MADLPPPQQHFIFERHAKREPFKPPSGGPKPRSIPRRDRLVHGAKLLAQLESLKSPLALDEQSEGLDLQIEFEGFPDVELAFESLARERSGIELLNVREDGAKTFATVFVPLHKLHHFENLIDAYLSRKTDKNGRALDHQRLVDAINAIRRAGVRALWTDEADLFPSDLAEKIWWEAWLSLRQSNVEQFRTRAAEAGIEVAEGELAFPERLVMLVRASVAQLESAPLLLNSIAELRRAKETADLFDNMDLKEQADWITEFLSRLQHALSDDSVPRICLLDTGINRGHPLIEPALAEEDLHTLDPAWGLNDDHGHGTQMAGIALYGDLTPHLAGTEAVVLRHRLESVKLLPKDGGNEGDARHHGFLTVEAVSRPEVSSPTRKRIFGMAVTSKDGRDRGRPSSWSSAVDRLAADSDAEGLNPRLLIVSGGNVGDSHAWGSYPESCDTSSIHDPGQAWNAITVGASTNLATVTDGSDLVPVAPGGGLSPFSSTSFTWERFWPLKPDVLFEGGNVAKNVLGPVPTQSLSLLTTHHQPASLMLTTTRATSAAMAQASRMAATILEMYPGLWPETIRGLMVHSAEWTSRMRAQYLPATGNATKSDYVRLIRRCGFGIPQLERALWTVSNSLTLIAQDSLTPFKKEGSNGITSNEMAFHDLPWPKEVLESLGEAEVTLRVTLSYFIEPNPSARGVRSRYSYESHGYRFDVIRPTESREAFSKRINLASREVDEDMPDAPEDANWIIGKQARHRGSVHSDVWIGPAAALASRGVIAVYPSGGWWKSRPALGKHDKTARYALVVSILAPQLEVDLVTEVAAKVVTVVSIPS